MSNFDLSRNLNDEDWVGFGGVTAAYAVNRQGWIALLRSICYPAVGVVVAGARRTVG